MTVVGRQDGPVAALRAGAVGLAERAAAAGLPLSIGWLWRFGGAPADPWRFGEPASPAEGSEPAAPVATSALRGFRAALAGEPGDPRAWAVALASLAAARAAGPGALLRLERSVGGGAIPALYWLDDGAALAPGLLADDPGPAARPPRRDEALAAAARLCDGVAMRLGLGRGGVRVEPPLALLPLRRAAGGGWGPGVPPDPRADPVAPPSGAAARRAASAAAGGRPAMVAGVEGEAILVALPPVGTFDDHLELLFALGDAADGAPLPVIVDGPPPPDDARLRRATAAADVGGLCVELSPGAPPVALGAVEGAILRAARDAGPATAAELLVGDRPGGGSALAMRPEAAARAVGAWLRRPGLGALFSGRRGSPAHALGPVAAVALEAALAAAVRSAPSPARARGLAAALTAVDPAYETRRGFAALRWRGLAAPVDPVDAAVVECLSLALLAAAAVDRAPPRVGAADAAEAALFPSLASADALQAAAELGADGPGFLSALRRACEARFPGIGFAAGPGLRISARVAAGPGPGAAAVEVALEGPQAEGVGVWASGVAAPLRPSPHLGGFVACILWQAQADPHGPFAAADAADAVVLEAAPREGGAPILALEVSAAQGRATPVQAGDRPLGPWRPTGDLRLPGVLDLRSTLAEGGVSSP